MQNSSSATAAWQHRFIQVNHVNLHYVTQGEGELVILLHGFFEFWYSWRHQLPALAKHFKVVVPDLRGYNDSDKPLTGHDLETLSQDVVGLIHGLGYRAAHIVGHGWGGTLAWHLAQRCPGMLKRLVVLSGVHPQQWHQSLLSNLEVMRRSWPIWVSQLPTLPEWMLQPVLPRLVTTLFQSEAIRKNAFSAQDRLLYEAALRKPGVLSAALKQYRQILAPQAWLGNLLTPLPPIQVPTLVLWGEDDSLLHRTFSDSLERYVAAPLAIKQIPQCGHWVQQEVPQTVNRALLSFL